MKAIATEIIVAQRSADIQSLQSQIKTQNDYPVSGKSFAEYLASYDVKSSEPEKRPVESTSMKKAETKNSSESKAEKPADTVSKASDNVPTDETIEKVDESQSSSKEVKKEDAKDGDSVVEEKKNLKKDEKPETAEEKLSYLRLDLIKEENVEVNGAAQSVEKDGSEIKIMPNEISGKVASADGENGIELLKNANAADGIDFEVGDVSAEALALESVQGDSAKDTELGFGRTEVPLGEIAADSRLDQINVEKSSIAESGLDSTKSEKSKSKLTVTDLRTQKTGKEINVAKLDDAEPKLKVTTVIEGSDTATITMDLNQPQQNVADNVLSLNNQAAGADGSNFQAMLNNQIQENATEFVKASNLILKDNGKGTINLVLHPDDLGDVRFHLSLDGNKITGHITVNTKEALEVFKDNAQTLREAFIKSGFENAGFEVSYNSNGGNGEFEQQRQSQNYFFAKRGYGVLNEVVADEIMAADDNFGEFNINIVA